jgi:hypothetical protein
MTISERRRRESGGDRAPVFTALAIGADGRSAVVSRESLVTRPALYIANDRRY